MHDDDAGPDGSPERGGPRRSRRAGVIRRLGLAALASIALLAALVIAIDLGWQRERIVRIALEIAEARLGVDVSLDRAVGRLSRGIELRDVRLRVDGETLARADSIAVRWDVFSLLTSERWIAESVRVEGWSLRLRRTAEGRWTPLEDLLARLAKPDDEIAASPEAAAGPDLLVRRIELAEGEVELQVEPGEALRKRVISEKPVETLRAIFRAEGDIEDLQVGPRDPAAVETARFDAELVELHSGLPEFDRRARAGLEVELVGARLDSLVAHLGAPGMEGRIEASGRLDQLDRVAVEIEAADLSPLSGWLQTSRLIEGELDAQATLAGPPTALTGRLQARARGLRFEAVRAEELELELELDDPISSLWAAPGQMDARLKLHARGLDPGALDRGWLPPGEAELELEASVAAGRLDLRQASLRLAGLVLEASGRASLEEIERLELRFDLEAVQPWLEPLPVELPLAGGLRGEGWIEGPPRSPRGRLRVRSDRLILEDRPLGPLDLSVDRVGDGPAEARLVWGPDEDPHLRLVATIDPARERVDLDGSGDAAAWTAWDGRVPSIQAAVRAEGFVARSTQGLRFAGSLRANDTVVEGRSLGRFEIVAASARGEQVEISKLQLEGPLGRLRLQEPATIALGSEGAWDLAPVRLSAALPVDPVGQPDAAEAGGPGAFQLAASGRRDEIDALTLRAEALPVALVDAFRADPDLPLAGRLEGHLSWSRSRQPGWTAGDLVWIDPEIGSVQPDRIAARWSANGQGVDLALRTWLADRSPLVVEGRIETPGGPGRQADLTELLELERFSLRAALEDWDLSTLQTLAPGWMRRLAGRASGTARIERDASGLRLDGRMLLSEGGFTVPILRRRFAPIEGLVILDDRTFRIESMRVGGEEGSAAMTGALHLAAGGSPEIEGEIRFDRLPFARSSVAWVDLLGGLRLEGTWARPVVRGSLAVEEAKIGVPAADDPILKEIRIAGRSGNGALVEKPTETQGPFAAADVDVSLSVPGNTRVLGQGANLFVEGEARVLKIPAGPLRVQGEARVVNGIYTFQGRRFRVRRGRVLLTGDERLDPVLDIEARLPVADIVAIVEVSGRLSSPIVRLGSEPRRSEQDVLAYLLFGRPADQVGAAGGTRFEAAAARLVAGVAERELREVLGDAMPVDTIEIGADEEGRTSELGFGKYLSRNLFFRYVHILGDEPSDQVSLEYRLNDSFSVGSSVSTTGDAGLDLIFRRDF